MTEDERIFISYWFIRIHSINVCNFLNGYFGFQNPFGNKCSIDSSIFIKQTIEFKNTFLEKLIY